MIINAGIKEVIYQDNYGYTTQTANLLESVNIICRQIITDKGKI